MASFDTLDDLAEAVNSGSVPVTTLSQWITLNQDRVNAFAEATNDHQWIHSDPVRALSGPFGGTIVHGHLMLSLLPALASGMLQIGNVEMGINYGLNSVRFISPVLVGERVRANTTLINARWASGGLRVESEVTIEQSGSTKPALVATAIALYFPQSEA